MLSARTVGLLAAASASACSPSFIPNTDVEDTSENRKIVNYCEVYRHAMEDKNIAQLLKMASPRYHEDGGNTNPEDDIDYEGLKDFFSNTFSKADQIRYEIRYRKITFTETNHVFVDYTYAASYKIPGIKSLDDLCVKSNGKQPGCYEWHHTVADNRLDLVPDGDGFKILAGM
jgi:hypothetical protein